jgi:hypothetical protein
MPVAINFNSDTPTAPTGACNVVFQTDGLTPMASWTAFDPLMIGDTGTGGWSGNAPAPAAGDAAAGKYLSAAGTWSAPFSAGLPVYANNAAAVAGGLAVGAFYRTGADPDPVCVVH